MHVCCISSQKGMIKKQTNHEINCAKISDSFQLKKYFFTEYLVQERMLRTLVYFCSNINSNPSEKLKHANN